MKFPAVTFLLLCVSAPLPSIASHQTVTTPGTRPVYVFIPSSCPHPELSDDMTGQGRGPVTSRDNNEPLRSLKFHNDEDWALLLVRTLCYMGSINP